LYHNERPFPSASKNDVAKLMRRWTMNGLVHRSKVEGIR
jgi:hypothetical protein